MGRLIAIILGGAALALFVPLLLPVQLDAVNDLWHSLLGDWYARLAGPAAVEMVEGKRVETPPGAAAGIFAGLALVLIAVRGKD